MRIISKDLEHKKIDNNKLIKYGFCNENNIYYYEKNILNDEFKVIVKIENNKMITKLIENSINDEYLMADVKTSVGEFVGKIKDEYNKVITDIINNCTVDDFYKSNQTKDVINYISKKYNDNIEHLWNSNPDYGIWRNKVNNKWYSLLMVIPKNKLGIDSNETVEIIDIRYQKGNTSEIVDNKNIYGGYHMNKNSWITIILNGNMDNKEIYKLIDNSYDLSLKK